MRWLPHLGGLFLAFVALPVVASEPEAPAEAPGAKPFVAFELGLSVPTTGNDTSIVAIVPRFLGKTPLGANTELTMDLGLSTVRVSRGGRSDSAVRIGNPTFATQYHLESQASDFWVGLGVTLPIARFGDDPREGVVAYGFAWGAEGLWNLWRWTPDTFTMFVPAKWTAEVSPVLRFEVEPAVALYLPTTDASDTFIGFQAAARLAYVVGRSWFALGVQGVALVVPDADDTAQVALVPQAHWAFGAAFFDVRLVVNVDEPYGFAFDAGRIWGLFTGVGVEL